MAESNDNPQQPQTTEENPQAPPQKQFVATHVYTKDVSFEMPDIPPMFIDDNEQWEPKIESSLGNRVIRFNEGLHEVTLTVTVTAKLKDKTAYLAEVHQAGLFKIQGFTQAEVGELLGNHCPNLLFPFAREVIANLVVKGGFPPLLLRPVNFNAIYQDRLKELKEQQQSRSEADS